MPLNDPTLPRAYEASILNPLHYKFLATPLLTDKKTDVDKTSDKRSMAGRGSLTCKWTCQSVSHKNL